MEKRNEVQKIGLGSDLRELYRLIDNGRRTGKIKRRGASLRTMCMIGRLRSDSASNQFVPRKIDTIGELYSFSEKEMLYGFRGYKRKTWLKLNEILGECGLPSLNLPQEYTSDQ